MKTTLVTLLMIVCTAAAEPADEKLALAYQMQEAVLRTQDVGKVQDLLARGVDINAPIGCGTFSPLDGAVHTQNVGMLKFLLAHGAKPRGHELANAAFASEHQQALEMVKALLDAGVAPNTRSDYSNALISATYRENVDLVRLLLSQRGIKIDETDVDGYTALMWAVKHGSTDIVDMLLNAGASVAVKNQRGETASTLARQEIEKQQAIISKLNATLQ
ncbi:ankyrin repeat domain-containing protein [Verrucomicrobiota bacterium sgz303538]